MDLGSADSAFCRTLSSSGNVVEDAIRQRRGCQRQLLSRADWRPALAKVDRPVLVLCQAALKAMAGDPVAAAIPTARAEAFEDAGHALFVDDADRFSATLEDLIQHLPQQQVR